MLRNDGGKERKRHDLAEEELQRARDKWNEDWVERLDFINKRLYGQNKARAYINDTDEANAWILSNICKTIKAFTAWAWISDFYHTSETKKNGKLLFVAVGTGIAIYALYKYLK